MEWMPSYERVVGIMLVVGILAGGLGYLVKKNISAGARTWTRRRAQIQEAAEMVFVIGLVLAVTGAVLTACNGMGNHGGRSGVHRR